VVRGSEHRCSSPVRRRRACQCCGTHSRRRWPESDLYIAFSRGHTYSYGNISPEFYEDFEAAESHGKFFYKNINKNKEYPFRKEFTLYPHEIQGLKEVIENNKPEEDDE